MRTHIALLLCIMLCLCAAPPSKALDGVFMANANEAEWNAENACWVERHYIAAADEFSAFVYAPHAEEYERYGVRAPLVCEAYIGSATLNVSRLRWMKIGSSAYRQLCT